MGNKLTWQKRFLCFAIAAAMLTLDLPFQISSQNVFASEEVLDGLPDGIISPSVSTPSALEPAPFDTDEAVYSTQAYTLAPEVINLIPYNAGFEASDTGINWVEGYSDGWTVAFINAGIGSSISVDTSTSFKGRKSLMMASPSGAQLALTPMQNGIPVETGKTYKIGVWLKYADLKCLEENPEKKNSGILLTAEYIDASGEKTEVGAVNIAAPAFDKEPESSDWKYYEFKTTRPVPDGVNNLKVQVKLGGYGDVAGTLWVDDMVVSEVVNDGISMMADVPPVVVTGENLITTNPGFEADTLFNLVAQQSYSTGWTLDRWSAPAYTDGDRAITSDSGYPENSYSTKSLKIQHNQLRRTSLLPGPSQNSFIPVISGKRYQVSAYLKTKDISPTSNVHLRGRFGTEIADDGGADSIKIGGAVESDWSLYKFNTKAATASTLKAEILFGSAGTGATGTLWVDDMSVYEIAELVESISISATGNTSILVNGTTQLEANVLPSYATNKTLTWSSSDNSIASVDQSGLVTGNGSGTATITATATDGSGKVGSITINVSTTIVPPTSITVSPENVSIEVDSIVKLIADFQPVDTTDKSITWNSSNESVATVSTSGVVKGITPGNATITAKSNANNSLTDTSSVIVTAMQGVIGDNIVKNFNPSLENSSFSTVWTYGAFGNYDRKDNWEIWFATVPSTGTTQTVSIDTTVKRSGENSLKIHHENAGRTVPKIGDMTKNYLVPAEFGKMYRIGFWLKYTGTPTAFNGINLKATPMKGTTQDSAKTKAQGINKASSDGVGLNPTNGPLKKYEDGWEYWEIEYTGDLEGMDGMKIEVDFGHTSNVNAKGTLWIDDVTVYNLEVPLTKLTLDSGKTMEIGATETLSITTEPTNATDTSVTWASSDSTVASVSEAGVVTAHKIGTAKITATAKDSGKKVSNECIVTVVGSIVAVQSVSVSPTNPSITVDGTLQVQETVLPADASNKKVVWSSSNSAVATVSETGLVKGITQGTATITATAENTTKSGTTTVTVTGIPGVIGGNRAADFNPGFENSTGSWPQDGTKDNWTTGSFLNTGALVTIDTEVKHTGNKSLKIYNEKAIRTGVRVGASTHGWDVPVQPGEMIRMGVWLKYENVGTINNGIAFRGNFRNSSIQTLSGPSYLIKKANSDGTDLNPNAELKKYENGWEYYELNLSETPKDTDRLRIEIILGGNGNTTGTLWIDDLVVYKLAVPTTSIILDTYDVPLQVGTTQQINVTGIVPANATNAEIEWISDNPSVATVDQTTGLITAVGVGTTNVRAVTKDGTVSSNNCVVEVTNEPPRAVLVTDVKLNLSTTSIQVGGTKQLVATVSPVNAANKKLNWTSSNEGIVTVSGTGELRGTGAGSTTVKATSTDGSGIVAECTVTVTAIDQSQPNLLANYNSSFEDTKTDLAWLNSLAPLNYSQWIPTAGGVMSLDTSVSHTGNKSVKVQHSNLARTGINLGVLNGSTTKGYPVQRLDEYTLGVWIKAEDVSSQGVILRTLHYSDPTTFSEAAKTTAITGTTGWTYYEVKGTIGANVTHLGFEVLFGSANTATGTIWIDDAYLTIKSPDKVFIESLTFEKTTTTLRPNEELFINRTITPSNTTEMLNWASSDPNVVMVTSTGYVKALTAGTATITATSSDSNKTATCTITVAGEPYVSPNKVPNGGFEFTAQNNEWVGNIGAPGYKLWFATPGGKVSIDTEVVHSGGHSAKIEHTGNFRTGINIMSAEQGVPVSPGERYRAGVWVKTKDTTTVLIRTSHYNNAVKLTTGGDGPLTNVLGTQDWKLYEFFVTIPEGANYFRLEVIVGGNGNTTGTVWIDDFDIRLYDGLSKITVDKNLVLLSEGETVQLNATSEPDDASDKAIFWSSSNDSIATVDQTGLVTAISEGDAIIKASNTDGGVFGACTVSIQSKQTFQDIDAVRLRYYDRLTGNSKFTASDPDMVSTVNGSSTGLTNPEKTGSWDTLNKDPDRTYLWADINRTKNSADLNSTFARLRSMAYVYSLVGSPYYKNQALKDDILSALEWLYQNKYKEGMNAAERYDNWYNWEISIPKNLNDIMILLYEEMPQAQKDNFLRAIDWFLPDPRVRLSGTVETGANLLDKANAVAMRGVVGGSSFKIAQGLACVPNEYIYTTKEDGVYEDGSLVQHVNIAYTGGYGAVWLGNTSELMYAFKGSRWEINDPLTMNVFSWVFDVFAPVIYNGYFMDAVNGRGMSRTRTGSARGTILYLIRMVDSAPSEADKIKLKSFIKEVVYTDKLTENYYKSMSILDLALLKGIMNDPNIQRRGDILKTYVFAGMDRAVHIRNGFGFAISMFSDRISAFEYGNEENLHGWYTGIGMTNVYNADAGQYYYDYWPTVNSYRLSGTTTDGVYKTPIAWANYYNSKDWVGGSSINGLYSSIGMDFSLSLSTGSPLSGKKSWFNFDDEIVAIGSGISNTNGQKVETIVENRMIKDDGTNLLLVNGSPAVSNLGQSETLDSVRYAHLAGNVLNSDIGYYFPKASSIYALRESRTGSWYDINTAYSKNPITRNYLSLAFDHGTNPTNSSYEYVILPNKTNAGTELYSNNPDIVVLSTTNIVHAVREKTLGITAANFFMPGNLEFISASQPASVMVEQKIGHLAVSVSDPTQKLSTLTIELDRQNYDLVSADPQVTVVQTSPTIIIQVNVNKALGKSFSATFTGGGAATEYEANLEAVSNAKFAIENYAFNTSQVQISTEESARTWIASKLASIIPSGVSIGQIIVEDLIPATGNTNGSFKFTVVLSKGEGNNLASIVVSKDVTITPTTEEPSQPEEPTPPEQPAPPSDTTNPGTTPDNDSSNDNSTPQAYQSNPASTPTPKPATVSETTQPKSTQTISIGGTEVKELTAQDLAKNASGNKKTVVTVAIELSEGAKELEVKLPKATVKEFTKSDKISLEITSNLVHMHFNDKALSAISSQMADEVTFKASSIETASLSSEDKAKVGTRPVFEFVVSDGKNKVTDFGAGGKVTIGIPYILSPNEKPNQIIIYYITPDGKLETMKNCSYDKATGMVVFTTDHFSKFAIGHNETASFFKDIASNPYVYGIEFATARGLFNGTSKTTFSPDNTMTRAMFVTVIANLYGADTTGLKSTFDDVPSGAWYEGAVAWAVKNGIISGVGNNKFAPDETINREQVALILSNYLKLRGEVFDGTNADIDLSTVSPWARNAVSTMANAGIMKAIEKDFAPKYNMNRSETALIFTEFILKIVENK